MLDTGLRPVLATLGAWVVPTVVYLTPQSFDHSGCPVTTALTTLRAALDSTALVARKDPDDTSLRPTPGTLARTYP